VDKILHKDKRYNVFVSKVGEKQTKIDILKSDIKVLEEDHQRLKNDGNISIFSKINSNLL
jgi:hypothetical protein